MTNLLFLLIILFQFPIDNTLVTHNNSFSDQETEFNMLLNSHLNDDFESTEYASIINLIEKVTANKLDEYYDIIDSLYFSALSNIDITLDAHLLKDEIDKISLIANNETVSELKEILKRMDSDIGNKISLFWNRLNPNPLSPFNIRLFEHWERIDYAKNNFTRRNNSILNTDDRGDIFVKYGPPSKQVSGLLSFNSQMVRAWLREYDVINSHWTSNQELNNTFLANLISQQYNTPFYDIWIYDKVMERSLIFIFGNNGDTGQFEMVKSLEELIPSNTFRSRNELERFNSGPSLFLQLMMYDFFSIYDQFFSNAFHEIESQFLSRVNSISPEYSRSRMQIHRNRINSVQNQAPKQYSDYLNGVYNLDIESENYLTFDEKGLPAFFSFIKINEDDILKDEKLLPIRFSVFDQENVLNRTLYDSLIEKSAKNSMILSFRNKGTSTIALNSYSEGHILSDYFNSTQISRNEITLRKEISYENAWVGSLIVGKRRSTTQKTYNNNLLPFDITFENKFQNSDILTFYLGLKNTLNINKPFKYDLNVNIERIDRNFLFIPLPNETSFKYSLPSETLNIIDEKIVEIDISDLKPSSYKLIVNIFNKDTLQNVERSMKFLIE